MNLYSKRRQVLVESASVDWVALVPSANMVYFTGLHFHLSERPTLAFIGREGVVFILPQLELTKLETAEELNAKTFTWGDTEGYQGAFEQAIAWLGVTDGKTLAVDGMTMRVFEWLALARAGVSVAGVEDYGQKLLLQRAIKTPEEVSAMRGAIAISENALKNTMAWVKVGMTETEIATKLVQEQQALGSEGNPFEPIVLIGERSALPHGNTGDRVLKENDILLIDFGCRHEGYPSDITRTFVIGTPNETIRKIYETVQQANEMARRIARPGVTCGAVDNAAREVIEQAGYGAYFTHRTGHGIGLEGHELPQIASGVETVLQVGMTFTIEPGIYVPGVGGVRIEDDMLVTEDGCESLTTYPRDL